MQRLKLVWIAVLFWPLCACSTLSMRRGFDDLPLLTPAAYGAEAAASQRLTITRDAGGPNLVLDAALEVDPKELRVAGFLLGQRILLLAWDGKQLRESREPAVPEALSGRAVLRDLQLVYWPADAIRSGLPRGWRLEESSGQRSLYNGGTIVFEAVRKDAAPLGDASLRNHVGHYVITIETAHESR